VKVWVLRMTAKTTKGGKPRQGLPLTAATRQALEVWQEKRAALGIGDGPLFCTISEGKRQAGFAQGDGELVPGRALNPAYVRALVARLAKQAGITRRVHPHMLRHTALTALYDKTRDLRMVQTVAGHTTSRMTERYTHVHPLAVAEAMGALEGPEG
jgi:integrase